MLGVKWDAEPWDRIQSGDLKGLSIYGRAEKIPLHKSTPEPVEKELTVPFADESVVEILYASRSVAAKAAERFGFEGSEEEITHEHEFHDETHFMPGPDHEAYVDAYNAIAAGEQEIEASAGDGETDTSDAPESDDMQKDEDPCWEAIRWSGFRTTERRAVSRTTRSTMLISTNRSPPRRRKPAQKGQRLKPGPTNRRTRTT